MPQSTWRRWRRWRCREKRRQRRRRRASDGPGYRRLPLDSQTNARKNPSSIILQKRSSIIDELRFSGLPELGRPFSVDSIRRPVANLPPRVGDDGFDKTVKDIHGIVARSKILLGAMKSIRASTRHPLPQPPCRVRRSFGRAVAAREAALATGRPPPRVSSCRWPPPRVVDLRPSAPGVLRHPTRRKVRPFLGTIAT